MSKAAFRVPTAKSSRAHSSHKSPHSRQTRKSTNKQQDKRHFQPDQTGTTRWQDQQATTRGAQQPSRRSQERLTNLKGTKRTNAKSKQPHQMANVETLTKGLAKRARGGRAEHTGSCQSSPPRCTGHTSSISKLLELLPLTQQLWLPAKLQGCTAAAMLPPRHRSERRRRSEAAPRV